MLDRYNIKALEVEYMRDELCLNDIDCIDLLLEVERYFGVDEIHKCYQGIAKTWDIDIPYLLM